MCARLRNARISHTDLGSEAAMHLCSLVIVLLRGGIRALAQVGEYVLSGGNMRTKNAFCLGQRLGRCIERWMHCLWIKHHLPQCRVNTPANSNQGVRSGFAGEIRWLI